MDATTRDYLVSTIARLGQANHKAHARETTRAFVDCWLPLCIGARDAITIVQTGVRVRR